MKETNLPERVTLRINEGTMKRVRRQVKRGEYPNKSEAIRAYIRRGVKADEQDEQGRPRPLSLDTDD